MSGREELSDRVRERVAEQAPRPTASPLAKVAQLPTSPGVYELLDATGKVIYVGKAKSLRARVRSYLRENADDGACSTLPRRSVRDVRCIATHSEKEALLLENANHQAREAALNIRLVDDKTFLSIEVTTTRVAARSPRPPRAEGKGVAFGPTRAQARSARRSAS